MRVGVRNALRRNALSECTSAFRPVVCRRTARHPESLAGKPLHARSWRASCRLPAARDPWGVKPKEGEPGEGVGQALCIRGGRGGFWF